MAPKLFRGMVTFGQIRINIILPGVICRAAQAERQDFRHIRLKIGKHFPDTCHMHSCGAINRYGGSNCSEGFLGHFRYGVGY